MFYPMFVMVLLTFAVGIYLFALRFNSVKSRQISIGYYRLNKGASEPPEHMLAAANHFNNLFQFPVMFYVTCLMTMVMGLSGPLLVGLAWVFVATRIVHALIHLSYNNVIHRMLAFWTGAICVLAMWVVIATAIN
jgi:hypothetical protein